MEYGLATMIEVDGIERTAELCRSLGLQFIEINMNLPQYQAGNIDVNRFNEIARRYGVRYTIHADENANPFDFNLRIADAHLQSMLDNVALAKAIGAKIVNMHMPSGVYFTMPNEKIYLFNRYNEAFIARLESFKRAMEQAVGGTEISICIENCGCYLPFQIDAVDRLINIGAFALTYDIGHAACREKEMRLFFNERINKLKHMHIHGAKTSIDGRIRDHLSLNESELDTDYYLSLGRSVGASAVIEVKTVQGLADSVKWLRKCSNI